MYVYAITWTIILLKTTSGQITTSTATNSKLTFNHTVTTNDESQSTPDLVSICSSVCQVPSSASTEPDITPDVQPTQHHMDKIPLYIGAFYEGPGGGWDGSGCVPAIEMAIEHVNARSDILAEYELRAIWGDTMVSVTHKL